MSQEIEWLLKEKYGGEKSEAFFADCKRLALGEPLGYLIGYVPFLDCKIWLDSHPLIPRPETEFWVEQAIAEIKTAFPRQDLGQTQGPTSGNLRVLDLCAGSGCIGIATAKAIPDALVDFSEIDLSNFPTIEKNLAENDIDKNRYTINHTNLFNGLTQKYDFILTNPPYIDFTLNRVAPSVLEHEPYIALFGGEDGLDIISNIIKDAPKYLNPYGQLWIEHEPEQTKAINALASKNGFTCTIHKDQFGVNRFSVLVLQ